MKNYNKPNVLILGQYPPPYGGISTFVENLIKQDILSTYYTLTLYRIGRKSEKTSPPVQVINDVYDLVKFILTLRFKNADIIHIHTASYFSFIRNIPYLLISKFLSDCKIILHIHGGKFHKFFNKASKPEQHLIKLILKFPNSLILTSNAWVNIINKICTKCNRIYSIPNGYDEKIFHPESMEKARGILGLSKEKTILLTIGDLIECKGHRYLLDSMKEIVKIRNDVILYILGTGPLEKSICSSIKEYDLSNYVFLTGGNKTPNQIAHWINSCDVFVLPSLDEGNPTVMFECLACGKPFVGTTVGGMPDIISSEDYGLLCEPANPKDLEEKILIALTKNWDYKQILEYAGEFTWENISKKIMEIYSNMR